MDDSMQNMESNQALRVPSDNECSVCLEILVIDLPETFQLPCLHYFHKPCIASWLSQHSTCPNCRIEVSETIRYNLQNEDNSNSPDEDMPDSQDGQSTSEPQGGDNIETIIPIYVSDNEEYWEPQEWYITYYSDVLLAYVGETVVVIYVLY